MGRCTRTAEHHARDLALHALARVEGGAYISRVLDSTLGVASRLDRALATELTYGVVRRLGSLTAILRPFLRGPGMKRWPNLTRLALLLAAYQIVYLDRMAPGPAVASAVDQARESGGAALAAVVNAVLRRLVREGPPPPPIGDDPASLAAALSHPKWLAERWLARYGAHGARALMAFDNEAPPLSVRVVGGKEMADEALSLWQGLARGAYLPTVVHVRQASWPNDLDPVRSGQWVVQDEGAALSGALLAPQPGERIVDACAGLGTKTSDLAERVGPNGEVVAVDRMDKKLGVLSRTLGRMTATGRLAPVRTVAGDATALPRLVGELWDRVLVDAPCSGLGALRRRPEIRWRRSPEVFTTLADVQRRLLLAALSTVRPKGEVLYATCSLEPEETDDVVDAALASGVAEPRPFEDRLPKALRAFEYAPGRLRLSGPETGTDGFFYALCVRRGDKG